MQQKLKIMVLFLTLIAFGCGPMEGKETVQNKNEKEVILPVEGMACMACVARVRKELTAIEGIEKAKVDLQKRNATIIYNSDKVAIEKLQETINKMGYKAGEPNIDQE